MLIDITPAEAFELKAIAATRKVLRPIADKVRAAEDREAYKRLEFADIVPIVCLHCPFHDARANR